MRIAHLDCFSGISGDMLLGALVDAGLPVSVLQGLLDDLGLSTATVKAEPVMRAGIAATKVTIAGELAHVHTPREMLTLFDRLSCSQTARRCCKQTFLTLAQAEAAVHKRDLDGVHLHELGSLDTLVDIAGCVIGLEVLGIERVSASALNVGSGTVETAHGRLPVPAPATAAILVDLPVYSTGIEAELVTPTGAALAKNLVDAFAPLPGMCPRRVAYGAGERQLQQANVVRLVVGESARHPTLETVNVLETNIDDMNPELYGYLMERLQQEGALEVYLVPCQMKKNRPGTLLCVVCSSELAQKLTQFILRETTTLGVRITEARREKLTREVRHIATSLGQVRVKLAWDQGKIVGLAPEFEDLRALAEQTGTPLGQIFNTVRCEAAALLLQDAEGENAS